MNEKILLKADFNNQNWKKSFNQNSKLYMYGEKNTAIVKDPNNCHNQCFKVIYPEKKVGTQYTGCTFRSRFKESQDSVTLSYRLRFADDFNFVRGGKLPGLVGGHRDGKISSTVSGGVFATGQNGFSVRLCWGKDGRAGVYVYHVKEDDTLVEIGYEHAHNRSKKRPYSIYYMDNKDHTGMYFKPGKWYQITLTLSLNHVENSFVCTDGMIHCQVNKESCLSVQGLVFRSLPTLKIDSMMMTTFFGGSSLTMHGTQKDEVTYFDDVVVKKGISSILMEAN